MPSFDDLIPLLSEILPNAITDSGDALLSLRSCIARYLAGLQDNANVALALNNMEIVDAYVHCCVHLLTEMAHTNPTDGEDRPVFSIYQSKQLAKCMEFVICLGIYPHLSPGVSMPLDQRLEYFDKFLCPKPRDMSHRHTMLFKIAECFDAALRSPVHALCDLLSPKYFLSDYMAVLFQLSYGPLSDSTPNTAIIVRECRKRLRRLLSRLPRPFAFKELFIFQAGFCKPQTASKVRAPKWLQTACGRLITQLLIARRSCTENTSALQDLIIGVLDVHSNDPRHTPAIASALAHILATPPNAIGTNDCPQDAYYRSLAAQISELLKKYKAANPVKDVLRRVGYLVAVETIHQISEKDMVLGDMLFLRKPISEYLAMVVDFDEQTVETRTPTAGVIDTSDDCQVLSAKQLSDALELYSDLLDTRHPSRNLLSYLTRYSRLWFHLFALLTSASDDEEWEEGAHETIIECSDKSSTAPPICKLKTHLKEILLNLLKNSASAFHLLRDWLLLPPLDPITFALDASVSVAPCFPLRSGVLLRPALLLDPAEAASPLHPYRVCLAAGGVENSFGLTAARVAAAMELLLQSTPEQQRRQGNEDDIPNRLFADWSEIAGGEVDAGENRSALESHLLLSLITDINGHLIRSVDTKGVLVHGVPKFCQDDDDAEDENSAIVKNALTASLLASSMLDRMDPGLLWPRDPNLAVRLFSLTLSRLCLVLSSTSDEQVCRMQEESLSHLLGMLAFYVSHMERGDKVPSAVRDAFCRLIPLLQNIEQTVSSRARASGELARQLRISLSTRGAVDLEGPLRSHEKERRIEGTTANLYEPANASLIEEILPGDSQEDVDNSAEMDPKLAVIFDQLQDPFIPAHGHALIELSRLLEARDPCIASAGNRIFKILAEDMHHEDSYIYLSAIRALSAMGNAFTDRLLPLLCGRFSAADTGTVEYRLKLGEAIMRILRELGEVAPRYRDLTMASLLKASRDTAELVRAASLSNMAELCRLLGHGMRDVVYEVFFLIESSLRFDTSAMARKAGAFLARSLFVSSPVSLASGLPAYLPSDLLRDLHRLLRDRLSVERDADVLEQVEAALAELDARTRDSIFVKPDTPQSLIKEIRIMRPFD